MGGIPLQELNQLELEFLFLIHFQLYIPFKDLQDYANQLLSHSILNSSKQQTIIRYHPYHHQSKTKLSSTFTKKVEADPMF